MNIAGVDYITLEEAAAKCGCQPRKISAAASAGRIAWCRPGRKKLLSIRDVDAWLESQVCRAHRPAGRPRNVAGRAI